MSDPAIKKPVPIADLDSTTRKFAEGLRQKFAAEIARNPRAFKRSVIRILKHELPPKPGRPSDEGVTRATQMRAKGRTWPEIYPACIADYTSLDNAWRQFEQLRLRSAVRARRNALKRKNATLISTPKKPSASCSVLTARPSALG